MQTLTPNAEQAVHDLALRYRVSDDAVRTLLHAVAAGGGTMAQFYHGGLGGGGQWMLGGMTMVGDMFNHGLQATVSGLCTELSQLLASQPVFVAPPMGHGGSGAASQGWWPADLGSPSATGGQNDARYAVFPAARRLAILSGGRVAIHDTLDHQIGGVQQQQGGAFGTLSFGSQYGTFSVDSLPLVDPAGPAPVQASPPAAAPAGPPPQGTEAILAAVEGLAALHRKGILTDQEFGAKKAELLARL